VTILEFIVYGVGVGAVYSLLGTSIAITFRGSGVIDFSAAAVGMFGTFLYYQLHLIYGWPVVPALIVGLSTSVAIGAANHLLIMRRIMHAPLAARIVATLGLMLALIGIANLLFAPTGNAISVPSVLPSNLIHIWGATLPLSTLLIVPIAIAVTLVLIFVSRRTRFGLATSAVAEDPTIAATMGISSNVVAAVNWAIGAGVAMVAILLVTPAYSLQAQGLALIIVPALAVALVGDFNSLPIILAGGMALGIIQSEVSRYTTNPGWTTVVPMVIILGTLLLRGNYIPNKSDRSARVPSVGTGYIGYRTLIYVALGILIAVFVPVGWLSSFTISTLFALVVLSVVITLGFAGQLSLVQLSIAGMAAFFSASLIIKAGLPVWLAILIAPFGAMAVGVIVAVPALRTRGASLAIATLAMVELIDALVISNPSVGASLIAPMPNLSVFGIPFDSVLHARNFAILCMVALVICVAVTSNVRRGASGRRILAARANERAAMALGISVPGVKIYAFALSAFIAGIAGALFEAQLNFADFTNFTIIGSIETTINGVLGGAGWPSGALVGGVMSTGGVAGQAVGTVVTPGNWLLVISGLGAIAVVLQSGHGLVPLWKGQIQWLQSHMTRESKRVDRELSTRSSLAINDEEQLLKARPMILEARNVSVRFGGQLALDDVSLSLQPGEILGLIGPNGAGKSTLIDVLCGFCPVKGGDVLIDGEVANRWRPNKRSRAGIGRSFQSLELFDDMTIVENLRAASDPCPPGQWVRDLVWPQRTALSPSARAAIRAFHLEDVLAKLPTQVDYATRRLVAIARAVAGNPGVLLLDEPAAGLDSSGRSELGVLLAELKSQSNMAILLVEHDVDLVFSICDRVVLLDFGRVVSSGTAQEVRIDPALVISYLGLGLSDSSESESVNLSAAAPSNTSVIRE